MTGSGELATLEKTKDKVFTGLVAFLGSMGLILLTWILTKVVDIDVRLARMEDLKGRVDRVERWTEEHDRIDRERFAKVEGVR